MDIQIFEIEGTKQKLRWIKENANCDIVEIRCDGQVFSMDENHPEELSLNDIEQIMETYDCVIPRAEMKENDAEKTDGKPQEDQLWECCYSVIRDSFPAYEDVCRLHRGCRIRMQGNMLIARKAVFDGYCDWLLAVLSGICESYGENCEAEVFHALTGGLLRIWLMYHKVRVREERVKKFIPRAQDPKWKEMQLKKQYVKVILKGLIDDYQAGKQYDLIDSSPLYAGQEDKMPVWVCWWQGEDGAPELVKNCLKCLKQTLPDHASLHVITMRNVGEYITLPEWIVEKFAGGKITLTHLSDVLRFGLLYRYGGLWLDATYFVRPNFWEMLQNAGDFYVCKLRRAKWTYDISEGRWASNVFYGKPGNELFKFMHNAYCEYWRLQDELIDYYQMDYMIATAYDDFPNIKKMIDEVPAGNPEILTLAERMDDRFDEAEWEEWEKNTALFKLTYKRNFTKQTMIGEQTFYGAFMEGRL